MATTPRRRGLKPRGNSVFVSDELGKAVRAYRAFTNLSQQDVAERMTALLRQDNAEAQTTQQQRWHAQTVSEVERGRRIVTVEELLALALALNTSAANLLLPTDIADGYPLHYDLGGPQPVRSTQFRQLLAPTGQGRSPYVHVMVWKGNNPVALDDSQVAFADLLTLQEEQDLPVKAQEALTEAAARERESDGRESH